MIQVKFFGLARLALKISKLELEAKTVGSALEKISEMYDSISLKELKNCVIFVNGTNIVEDRRFNTKLNDGDEVHIISPSSGG